VISTADFANRLRKNARHLRKWARREGTTAYRLYDLDMPELPFAVDWYDGAVHVVEYPRRRMLREGSAQEAMDAVRAAIREVLEVPDELVFTKTHLPMQWGEEQYQRLDHGGAERVVLEHGLKLLVNLSDYLDTGLFLDHRPLRARVRKEARGKRFLNVFAYTGAFTVHAAARRRRWTSRRRTSTGPAATSSSTGSPAPPTPASEPTHATGWPAPPI
jgi:23S rRNA (cytosine1962-C5)-methyltransferase